MPRVKEEVIAIVGADANNLQDIDVSFPIGKVSMVVGVSGSGKSSLLQNTLAREGNLRLKTFLGIDQGLGLPRSQAFISSTPPTLYVGQNAFRASSRTTVATASGLLSLLRRIFVRWSTPVSSVTGKRVNPPSLDSYYHWILGHHNGRVSVWAIPLFLVASDGRAMAERLRKLGISEVIVRSETDSPQKWKVGRKVSLNKFRPLSSSTRHLVEASIGSVNLNRVTAKCESELLKLLDLAFEVGQGLVFIELFGNGVPALDSRVHWVTPEDPFLYSAPSEHLLSFNAPSHAASGACPQCQGLGISTVLKLDALVRNPKRSMHEGAFGLWTAKNYKNINIQHETIEGLRGIRGFDPDLPWEKLGDDAKCLVLYGSGDQLVTDRERNTGRKRSRPKPFSGFSSAIFRRIEKRSKSSEALMCLVEEGACPACGGSRWSQSARSLRLAHFSIDQLLDMDFENLVDVTAPGSKLAKNLPVAAEYHLAQIHRLAESFIGVGLGHLNSKRGMLHVSEGESRRLRLAAVLDGRHHGLCLLLDEPARGLHDEDLDRLAASLVSLRGKNTLILNEHRQRLGIAADHFVELGPRGGAEGGALVRSGAVPEGWWKSKAQDKRPSISVKSNGPKLKITGANYNNLVNVNVTIPLGHLVCIAGVSGAGKSSFLEGILVPGLHQLLGESSNSKKYSDNGGRWKSISCSKRLSGFFVLDQRSPVVNRRSTVATFIDLAATLRKHYSTLESAKAFGLRPSDFGFNGGSGRCNQCLGIGEIHESDYWVVCPSCGGARFEPSVLAVEDHVLKLNLAQLLDMAISDLLENPKLVSLIPTDILYMVEKLGIGHLALGRRLDTLSGGEVQRLRIARELIRETDTNLLFILDEPAAGLHKTDVSRLLQALDLLVREGHSVIVVEHNIDLIAAADWVLEFGPHSGVHGGKLVAKGVPREIKKHNTATGRMLRNVNKRPVLKKPRISRTKINCELSTSEVESALRWLRRLMGEDILPHENDIESEGYCVAVKVDRHALSGNHFIEYGGLDRELAALMIESQKVVDSKFGIEQLNVAWGARPDAILVIHPLVQEMYYWGKLLPRSLITKKKEQMLSRGLDWHDSNNVSKIRVGGSLFRCPEQASGVARKSVIESALLVGAGYVELRSGKELISTCCTRPLDLKRGIVSPLSMSAHDFQRQSRRGQCIACSGIGYVRSYNNSQIIGNKKLPIEDPRFLHEDALAVLKGVHRNILIPFFREMVKEGLWKTGVPFYKLKPWEREVVLFGFWSRPSLGTFIKNGKRNTSEVSSWLRWDGLHTYVHENLARGKDRWQKILTSSECRLECSQCSGTGLRSHADLLTLDGRTYREWLIGHTIGDLYAALGNIAMSSKRIESRCKRILTILAPLVNERLGDTRLDDPLISTHYKDYVPSVVSAFTNMLTVFEEGS